MRLGTSSLVVAAFIGPGTVLTCATAGVSFGYGLAWVLLFATAAVFLLQSLTAGTGILAGQGLGEAIRATATAPVHRAVAFTLVVLGLGIGCAAFEAGNLVGAAAGIQTVLEYDGDARLFVVVLAALAAVLLLLDLRQLVQALAVLVGLMSLVFLATVIVAPVDWGAALQGLVVPSVPSGSLVTVMALLGTTIVTYNLFLHPAATRRYWQGTPAAEAWRGELWGMALFVPLGGVVSLAILLSGATLFGQGAAVGEVRELAVLLEPVAGPVARYLFGFGLLAAGLTSAVTAPLAAAAGVSELFGWAPGSGRYRAVWAGVLAVGLLFGLTSLSPLRIIIAAQAANGILLPLIAAFVLYLARRQKALSLPRWYFAAGVLVTLICAGLGLRTLYWVWTQLGAG